MVLIDNINFFQSKFPVVREQLRVIETISDKSFQVEETRRGGKTLIYHQENKKVYFHSKYDPIREAQMLIDEYQDIGEKNIIFYGTGLGYHIELFVKENPKTNFYIFEPIEELAEKFLTTQNLSTPKYKNLKGISVGRENFEKDIGAFIELNRQSILIIELPMHRQLFEEEYKEFSQLFLRLVQSKRSSIATDFTFQRRWIINSMINFKEVLHTPNILIEKKGVFRDKPALLVAAGPSLNYEIDNIRYIKEKGLAYIFSVGSAINTLLYHDIYPDAATTYDPGEFNQNVFTKLKEKNIKEIPLIFGSSVGFETIQDYPGDKYHMIMSQDTVSNFYLNSTERRLDILLDAPTIAVVTFQLLANLGFNTIILAGQNLSYLDGSIHSEGIHYSRELTNEESERAIWVEGVSGKQVMSSQAYNDMRKQLELYIGTMENIRVINTTKYGAKIKGTDFIELKELIEEELKEKVVKEDWLSGNLTDYDKEDLKKQVENMELQLDEAYKWIREYNSNISKMFDLVRNRNFNQLDNMYSRLDVSIIALEANKFFTTFIIPINRVQYKLLIDAVQLSKIEKRRYKKHMDLLNAYKGFMDKCNNDIKLIKPIYEKMKKNIFEYIGD